MALAHWLRIVALICMKLSVSSCYVHIVQSRPRHLFPYEIYGASLHRAVVPCIDNSPSLAHCARKLFFKFAHTYFWAQMRVKYSHCRALVMMVTLPIDKEYNTNKCVFLHNTCRKKCNVPSSKGPCCMSSLWPVDRCSGLRMRSTMRSCG